MELIQVKKNEDKNVKNHRNKEENMNQGWIGRQKNDKGDDRRKEWRKSKEEEKMHEGTEERTDKMKGIKE